MNENYKICKDSNMFLRDLQYAMMSYFEKRERPINYQKAEVLSRDFISKLVDCNDLIKIDHKSWKMNFEVGKTKGG